MKPDYDWSNVLIAILLCFSLVILFFVVQAFNSWLSNKLRKRLESSAKAMLPAEPPTPEDVNGA